MIDAFSEPGVVAIIVAVVTGIPATIAAVLGHKANKQTKPNSGSSMRDSLDSLHLKLDSHISTTDKRFNAIEEYLTSPSTETTAQLKLLRSTDIKKAGSQ